MSETTTRGPGRPRTATNDGSPIIRGSLQMKHFGNASLRKALAWNPEAGEPKPDDIYVGNVTGHVTGFVEKIGTLPDGSEHTSMVLEGEFLGILALLDNAPVIASQVYLPNAMQRLVVNQFQALQKDEKLDFSVEIYATASLKSATGYEYVTVNKMAAVSPRLASLISFAAKAGANLPQKVVQKLGQVQVVQLGAEEAEQDMIGHDQQTTGMGGDDTTAGERANKEEKNAKKKHAA